MTPREYERKLAEYDARYAYESDEDYAERINEYKRRWAEHGVADDAEMDETKERAVQREATE